MTNTKLCRSRGIWPIWRATGLTLLLTTTAYGAESPSAADAERARIEYIQKALKGEASPVPGRRIIGAGTGFFVAPHHILTNHHVVERCAALTVRGVDGKMVPAQLLATEKPQDLALVKTDAVAADIAVFRGSATYQAGEAVSTIGYPDQGMPRIEPFLTVGTILGPDRNDGRPARFLIRADVRQGNSGGPVLDKDGIVIGVVNAKIDTVRVYQRTGRTVDNVGFAIANGPVLQFLTRLRIPLTTETGRSSMPVQDLLTKAKRFTVRVACWL